ncbi:MAG: hypothetical protein AB8B72_12365 [Crocinitomicaceae bacterium]
MKNLNRMACFALFAVLFSCEPAPADPDTNVNTNHSADDTDRSAKAEEVLPTNFLNFTQAKPIVKDYQNFAMNHVQYNGQMISGYTFTRQEIQTILAKGDTNELFLMWGLSGAGANKYLNLVIAPVQKGATENVMEKDSSFLISANPPNTSTFSIREIDTKGFDISHAKVQAFSTAFKTSVVIGHIQTASNSLKAYTLTSKDLNEVDIQNGLPDDVFVFIPIIAPAGSIADSSSPFYNIPHLSLAFGQIDGSGQYTGAYRDYCDPCPSQCMNYGNLFAQ